MSAMIHQSTDQRWKVSQIQMFHKWKIKQGLKSNKIAIQKSRLKKSGKRLKILKSKGSKRSLTRKKTEEKSIRENENLWSRFTKNLEIIGLVKLDHMRKMTICNHKILLLKQIILKTLTTSLLIKLETWAMKSSTKVLRVMSSNHKIF